MYIANESHASIQELECGVVDLPTRDLVLRQLELHFR